MALMPLKGKLFLLAKALYSPSFRYNGAKASTNMVIVDIKLLSGFTADTSPVRMGFKMICRILRCLKLLQMYLSLHDGLFLTAWNSPRCICPASGESWYWRGSCPSVSERGERPHTLGIFSTCHSHACVCASVLLFFTSVLQVPKGVPMSYTIRLKQVLVVKSIKPGVINVYDYYQTSTLSSFDSCTWLLPVSLIAFWSC